MSKKPAPTPDPLQQEMKRNPPKGQPRPAPTKATQPAAPKEDAPPAQPPMQPTPVYAVTVLEDMTPQELFYLWMRIQLSMNPQTGRERFSIPTETMNALTKRFLTRIE